MPGNKEIKNNNEQQTQSSTVWKITTLGMTLIVVVLAYNYVNDLSTPDTLVQPNVSAPSIKPQEPMPTEPLPVQPTVTPGARQTMEIDTELGKLQVELFADTAPIAVAELVKLTKSGYFNSDTVLEIRPGLGFVIAKVGGAVKSYQAKDELNTLPSLRGSVAISKSSASVAYLNNIFIGFKSQPELEKHYIIIGQVANGLKPIEKSAAGVKHKVNGFKLKDSEQKQVLQSAGGQGK